MSRFAKSFVLFLSFAGLLLGATNANAAACTAIASTAWNVQTTWGAGGTGCAGATGGIPGAADTVTVPTTFTVTVTAAAAATSLTVNGTGSVVNNSTLTISGVLAGTGGLTNGTAASILNIGGNATITTLTATFAGNTVNYTGAAQTAKVTTYSNLTLSGSLAKTFVTTPTVNGVLSMEGTATVTVTTGVVTYGAAATLQYNKPAAYTATTEEWLATFNGTGGVIIKNTGVITTGAAKVLSNGVPLTIDFGASLTTVASTLNVGGNLTVNGTLTGSTGAITLSGTARTIDGTGSIIATSTGTLLITTSRTILNTANLTIARPTTISAATTVTNNGIINKTTTAALNGANATTSIWVNAAGSTLNYAGTNAPMATGVLTASAANTVNYNGAAQTLEVPSGAPATYYHLTLSGSGIKTMPATAMTVTGNFTMSGAATATAAAALTVGGNFTIGVGTTFTAGAFNHTVSGNFDATGTFTNTGSTVTLNGATAQTISGTNPVAFNNLAVSAVNPNITLATNVTVVTVTTGTVTLTSTCPTDYTLTSTTPAQTLHSCSASVVSINRADPSPTSAATVSWTVIFNNSVTGVAPGNFTLVNSGLGGTPAITLVSGGGTTWTVTASTGTGTGTLGLNMANATLVTPTVTNLPFTGQVYSIVGAGVINTYYPGTASVLAGATSITLGAATGAATPIAIGDMLLIMQMQDATIDSTNTATYGTVSGTPTAGKYEYVLAASNVPTTGGTLTLSCGTLNAYTNANYVAGSSGQKRFQVIRVPVYASYTINAITASAWDGSTGGVLAFDVTGALTLNSATVDVSGMGFRGGASRMLAGPGATGANTDYVTLASVNNNASKGEGIAGTPQYVFTAPSTLTNTAVEGYPNGSHARGAPANAGGGGTDLDPPINDMNPGGGGGANGGAGGGGGLAWCPTFNALAPPLYGCGPYSGGLGGIPVAGLGATRLTLGGGGGGGTTNNGTGALAGGLSSSGAAGGGIIMLRAGSMTGAATFNANGSNGDSTIRNDGSGGGGAGGVVLISAGSGIGGATINVNGGNGGSNLVPPGTTSPPHGPGGGGGGGYAITSAATASCSSIAGLNGVTYNVGVLFGAYGSTPGSAGSCVTGLTAAQIPGTTLGATSCIDHYELSVPASSITCLPTTVTVTACMDSANPCTPVATIAAGSATLATVSVPASSPTIGAVTFPPSVATTTLSDPLAVDGTAVTVSLNSASIAAQYAATCRGGVGGCTTTFNTAGFIFSSSAGGGIATIPTQVAGTSSGTYYLRAVKTGTTTQDCVAALTGANTVNFAYECNNPATCYAANLMSVNGGAATTIARNNNGGHASNTSVNMTFDANGNAPFTFNYSDVGQVTLWANKTVNSAVLTGSTNPFVVKPGGFVLSGIMRTSDSFANPAAVDANGIKFVKAGEAFSATVTAVTSTVSTAYNYGQEISPEGVKLTNALVTGLGLTNNPAVSGTFGAFSNGVATGTAFTWNEVGIITLTPSILSGNYLSVAGDTTGTASGNVGRFYPDHFAITSPSTAAACSTGTAFTYFGQDGFTSSFTLAAQNFANNPTVNYAGAFAKLGLTTWSNFGFTAATLPAGSALAASATAPTGTWSGGSANPVSAKHQISRPTALTGPTTVTLSALPVDSDGVTMPSPTSLGTMLLRYGKFVISNASGSERQNLPVTISAMYYGSPAGWSANTDDGCTALPVAPFTPHGTNTTTNACYTAACTSNTGGAVNSVWLHDVGGTLIAQAAAPNASSGATLTSGAGTVTLTAPGFPGTPTPGTLEFTLVAPPWLRTNSGTLAGAACTSASFGCDPMSRITFGVYGPATNKSKYIYIRENY